MRLTLYRLISLATVLVLSCPFAVHAARPNYNYLGVAYSWQQLGDEPSCTQDGFLVQGSIAHSDTAFWQAEYVDVSSDSWCGSKTSQLTYGLRGDFGSSSNLYGALSVLYRDFDADEDVGLGAEFGMRTMILGHLEIKGLLGVDRVGDIENFYGGGLVSYWLNRSFSLTAEVLLSDRDQEVANLGVRFNF